MIFFFLVFCFLLLNARRRVLDPAQSSVTRTSCFKTFSISTFICCYLPANFTAHVKTFNCFFALFLFSLDVLYEVVALLTLQALNTLARAPETYRLSLQQVCHDGRHGVERGQSGQTHPQTLSTVRGLRGPRLAARTHTCSGLSALAAPPGEGPKPPGPRYQPAAVPPEGDGEGAVASPLRLAFS